MKQLRTILLSLLASIALVLTAGVSPAHATSSYLCRGYASCQSHGFSHAGYQQAAKNKYWLMSAGHNCTNYVAYRMVKNGLANTRPWSGTGNAYNWGVANRSKVDQTPAVGAVAWWTKNVRGAGSLGHVAYVERVVSDDELIISEDNWGGNFDWRRVRRSSGWPTGFVHFKDSAVGSPRGWLDVASSPQAGQLSIRGWTFDPNKKTAYVSIRVYVGGPAGVGRRMDLNAAKLSRPDVARAYPGVGSHHGFAQTVKVKEKGTVRVYVYGLNKSNTPGIRALIGVKNVTIR